MQACAVDKRSEEPSMYPGRPRAWCRRRGIQMSDEQRMVTEFHRAFDIVIGTSPAIPDPATCALRMNLMQEEFDELHEALTQGDVEAVAKELADVLYVVYGTAVSCGIDMAPVFREVHRSNMSKVGGHKRADGKWIKPPNYSPAHLQPILAAQGAPVRPRAASTVAGVQARRDTVLWHLQTHTSTFIPQALVSRQSQDERPASPPASEGSVRDGARLAPMPTSSTPTEGAAHATRVRRQGRAASHAALRTVRQKLHTAITPQRCQRTAVKPGLYLSLSMSSLWLPLQSFAVPCPLHAKAYRPTTV